MSTVRPKRLDEWYRLINSIHLDLNFFRTPESVFTHVVEVVGGLSILASHKKKPGVAPAEFLAKSLGWWMSLCGKVGVRSIEAMLWAKFPYVCPYCQMCPHDSKRCKEVRSIRRTPDWERLRAIGKTNKRPETFTAWRAMFDKIYQRTETSTYEIDFSRLQEEMGELAEAVRVLPITRNYFLNEAADVFAWIMGVANTYVYQMTSGSNGEDSVETALWEEYPGCCRVCKGRICKCPPLLKSTLGRIALEMPDFVADEVGTPMLFSFEEAYEFFSVGERVINVDGQQIEVTTAMLAGIREAIDQLLATTQNIEAVQSLVDARTIAHMYELRELVARDEITQRSLDEMIAALSALGPEARSGLRDFTMGFTSSAAASVVVEAIKGALHVT